MAKRGPRSSDLPIVSARNSCPFELLSVQHTLLKAQYQQAYTLQASLHSVTGEELHTEDHGEALILEEKQLTQGPGLSNLWAALPFMQHCLAPILPALPQPDSGT